jgi:hypothetical protein
LEEDTMSLICPENCAYLDRVTPECRTLATDSVFELPRMVDKRPWLAHAFTELLQAQDAGRIAPGIGDFRITDDTLNMAFRVLGSIKYRFLPNPSVSALSGGGVQITWASGANAIEVSVFPGEGVGAARLVDDAPQKVLDLGAAEYGQVNELLADFVG